MKGSPQQPQCGFSARVVGVLDGVLDSYGHVDILSDEELRQGLKVYADWPTFPQLWHQGALLGGCDIVEQMDSDGSLCELLGIQDAPPAPSITVTPEAADYIRSVTQADNPRLRLRISRDFRYAFTEAEPITAHDVEAGDGVRLVFDRGSARRAEGMTLGLETSGANPQLVIDNPNEPARVVQLPVEAYKSWLDQGRDHLLIDVRNPHEQAVASLGGRLLDEETVGWLTEQPKDTVLVFHCHHGVRSQHAAEYFLERGFQRLFNLAGGIDAWSQRIDGSVPRY